MISVRRRNGSSSGGGTPGGSNTQIQYNNAGSFGGMPVDYTLDGVDSITWKVENQTVAAESGISLNLRGSFSDLAGGDGGNLNFIPGAAHGTNGSVQSFTISVPGAGYIVNDVLTGDDFLGGSDFQIRVDSIDGSGGIVTYTILDGGEGYAYDSIPNEFPVYMLNGTGSGFEITNVVKQYYRGGAFYATGGDTDTPSGNGLYGLRGGDIVLQGGGSLSGFQGDIIEYGRVFQVFSDDVASAVDVFRVKASSGQTLTFMNTYGAQEWRFDFGAGGGAVGRIRYSTPGGKPGIIIETTSSFIHRFDMTNTDSVFTLGYVAGSAGGNGATISLTDTFKVGIGDGMSSPTAILHLKAGTTAANTAPLKFDTGTSMTTAEAGAVEFTTDDLFFTITTSAARKRLLMADPVGGLTSSRVPFSTTNGRLTDDADMTFATDTLSVTGLIVGTTKVTSYNGISTVSNGVPSEIVTIDSTGLTANVGATTLYSVPSSGAGMYRISAYLVTTTAASVSSTMPNAQVVYTDKDSNTSVTLDISPILGAAGLGQSGLLTANTVGTVFSGIAVIYVKASTTVQYQTVNYASTAAGMAYALHIKLELLG